MISQQPYLPDAPGEAPSPDATTSSQSLEALQAAKTAAESSLATVHAEMLAFKQQSADAEAKSRADRKVRSIACVYNQAVGCSVATVS